MDDQQQVRPATTPAQGESGGAESLGPVGRLAGIYFTPTDVFADIDRRPTWLVPVLISIVIAVGFSLYFQMRVHVDYEQLIRQQMEERAARSGSQLSEEQIHQSISWGVKFAKWAAPLAAVFLPAILLVLAGVLFFAFQMAQAETTFKKAFSVVAWAYAGRTLVEYALNVIVITVNPQAVDPSHAQDITMTNLGAFFSAKQIPPALHSFLSSVDLFTLWLLILLIIGFKAISKKFTTGKSATIVVGLWLLYVLIKVGWNALRG